MGGGRRGQGRSLGGLPSLATAGSPGRPEGWGFSGLALQDDASICVPQLCPALELSGAWRRWSSSPGSEPDGPRALLVASRGWAAALPVPGPPQARPSPCTGDGRRGCPSGWESATPGDPWAASRPQVPFLLGVSGVVRAPLGQFWREERSDPLLPNMIVSPPDHTGTNRSERKPA